MNVKKIRPGLIAAVLLAVIFIISLSIRTALPAERIFSDVGIKYSSADAYYNMRQVDNLAANYPDHTEVDPYLIHPGASGQIHIRFFAWFLATVSWILGLGAPTQHVIDLVGVYTPAILGALMVIPVYIIGKELFGRWAGLISALLIAITPGEFLGRSILGFADYHIAESLFTAVSIMFLILAMKNASRRQITFDMIKQPDWAVIRRPLIYGLLGGFFLGLYIHTWTGSLLFVFIIFLYLVIQFFIDHLRKKSTEYLCFVSVPFFLIALILSILVSSGRLYYASLVIALVAPVVLCGVSWYFARKSVKPAFYPLTILGLGLAGLGLFYLASPTLVSTMLNSFTNFIPQGAQTTTIEMQPLISDKYTLQYGSMFTIAWGNYPGLISIEQSTAGVTFHNILSFMSTNFFFSLVSICVLIYLVIRRGENGKILLVIWSLIILVSNLIQRRFGYYYAVNVSLLVGYLAIETAPFLAYGIWRIFGLGGSRISLSGSEEKKEEKESKVADKKAKPDRSDSFKDARNAVTLVSVMIVLAVIFTYNTVNTTILTAKAAQFAPSDEWKSSLEWLKENTPEPFGNPDSYYDIYKRPPVGENFTYPESAYGVLAWWDYGYWITRIGHRLPTANPSQNPDVLTDIATFFISKDIGPAEEIIQRADAKYVIIDNETALDKFHAIAAWSGEDLTEYFEYYVAQVDGTWKYGILFYPKFYETVVTRLYGFNGEAVTTDNVSVISFREVTDVSGNVFKQITGESTFASIEDAETFISGQESPDFRIVSKSPYISPVPLDKMEEFRLIYYSGMESADRDPNQMPPIKIFEYLK